MQTINIIISLLALGGVLVSAQLSPWTYLGCADETEGRSLRGLSRSGNMTIDICLAFCTAGYPLAGLEYGNECFCGHTLLNDSSVGKAGCDMPCTGGPTNTSICGGVNRLSVYFNPSYVLPSIIPVITTESAVYNALGCYTEGKTGRALTGSLTTSESMTPQMCVETCKGKEYDYAGVEFGTECFCGNTLSNESSSIAATECDMNCGGDPKAYCGGSMKLVLYQKATTA